jgi:type II secretory pathway pseudopilin PulG
MDPWETIAVAGVGVASTLLVQYASRRVTRRDKKLEQRRAFIDSALDSLRDAWLVTPFDSENVANFSPNSPSREQRYSDPSASRIALYLQFRMLILSADVQKRQVQDEFQTNPYLVYEEHMAKTGPLLAGWASGKLRYGPRAVERWVWTSSEELSPTAGTSVKEMRKHARRYARANRPRP